MLHKEELYQMTKYFVISQFSYRMTVIKNLPQLQKLDNVMVQPDEVGEAMRRGVELVHPHDRPIPGQMVYENNYGPASYQVRICIRYLKQMAFVIFLSD